MYSVLMLKILWKLQTARSEISLSKELNQRITNFGDCGAIPMVSEIWIEVYMDNVTWQLFTNSTPPTFLYHKKNISMLEIYIRVRYLMRVCVGVVASVAVGV